MHPHHTLTARRYGISLILVLTGTLAGVLHNQTTDSGRVDPISSTVRGVIAPPAGAIEHAFRWLGAQTAWLFRGRSSSADNARLMARIETLTSENASLREASIKLDQLRQDLGFVRSLPLRPIAADVVVRRPDANFDTLLISAGSAAGVRPNSVVVTRAGVVGRVIDVSPGTSSVLLLTDQNSGIGAMVQRAASRAKGVCKGDGSSVVTMSYLNAAADVMPGDLIVSSGLGGVFPAGLVIGRVIDVRPDEGNLNKLARVRLAANLDRLEQVYVLK